MEYSDRLRLLWDENGVSVDGDKIMYIIGKYLSEKGWVSSNTIVTTKACLTFGSYKALGSRREFKRL